jgi:uncharacterized protein
MEFASAVRPLLIRDEARHNLMFGLCSTLIETPEVYPEFGLWVVEEEARPVGAALMTPPHNLVVARPAVEGATVELTQALQAEGADLPGVTGAVPEVDEFAEVWGRLSGTTRRRRMAQRIYRLSEVRPVGATAGRMRRAIQSDRDLLVGWLEEFSNEALEDVASRPADQIVDHRLRSSTGGFSLWQDGRPVSVAGWGGRTPHGVRIGPVYTPPELRRRGYATALVAALSSRLLADGIEFCFLYTDLANPTSNRIYQDIGYEPVCDSTDYAFEPPPA